MGLNNENDGRGIIRSHFTCLGWDLTMKIMGGGIIRCRFTCLGRDLTTKMVEGVGQVSPGIFSGFSGFQALRPAVAPGTAFLATPGRRLRRLAGNKLVDAGFFLPTKCGFHDGHPAKIFGRLTILVPVRRRPGVV